MNSSFTQLFGLAEDDGDDDVVVDHQPTPPWFGSPEDELGAVVPLGTVIGRAEKGVVALRHATVHSTGIVFNVLALTRGLSNAQSSGVFHEQHPFEQDDEPPPGFRGSDWSCRLVRASRTWTAISIVGAS